MEGAGVRAALGRQGNRSHVTGTGAPDPPSEKPLLSLTPVPALDPEVTNTLPS